ncbi:MAG: hypothetical protein EOO75_15690 [Myxococcales bacterium]|nr:MAG: hypothetical protein EOO75_15690 [Myxococcales bacterium]
MAKALSQWTVSPHSPLESLEPDLWRVEQPLATMPLRRVMTVARRQDGGLVIHNGVALDEPSMRTLEAAGEPAFLLVPNALHRQDARIFKDRYPRLRVVAPTRARPKVEEVVPVDLTYDQFPADGAVRLETMAGTDESEGLMIVTSSAGTSVVLNDAVFNMPHPPGLKGLVVRLMGSSGGPRVSRLARVGLVKDRAAFRDHLVRLAALPSLRRVIVSHHEVISDDPAGTLRRVAATL